MSALLLDLLAVFNLKNIGTKYYIYIYIQVYKGNVGRDSVVVMATRYGLDSPGIEFRYGRDFLHPSRPNLGSNQLPKQWVRGLSRE